MMHEVWLTPDTARDCAGCKGILQEMEEQRSHSARVYRIFCQYERQEYVLVTTSKEVSLGLNLFSEWARNYLCWFLEEEFKNTDYPSEVLLALAPQGTPVAKGNKLFVTRTADRDGKIFFHLSPAH